MNLVEKKCVPCEGGISPLGAEQIEEYSRKLSMPWEVIEGKKIERKFSFKDFKEAMEFVNKAAQIAEEEGHHPDIYISYNKVEFRLWTHSIGGLHENDFIMAEKINKLADQTL